MSVMIAQLCGVTDIHLLFTLAALMAVSREPPLFCLLVRQGSSPQQPGECLHTAGGRGAGDPRPAQREVPMARRREAGQGMAGPAA